jgi:hypothetical protein
MVDRMRHFFGNTHPPVQQRRLCFQFRQRADDAQAICNIPSTPLADGKRENLQCRLFRRTDEQGATGVISFDGKGNAARRAA